MCGATRLTPAPFNPCAGCPTLGTCAVNRECRKPAPAKSTNPKKAMGMAKPPMHLIPDSAMIHAAMAFKDGAAKYGPYNWRDDPVDITTYIAAAKRHLALYFNGQRVTSDTGVHNLGAVIACCAILLDAEAHGSLIDDRPKTQNLEAVMDEFTVGKGLAKGCPVARQAANDAGAGE